MEPVKLLNYFRVERSTFIDEHFYCRGNYLYVAESGTYSYCVNGQSWQVSQWECVLFRKDTYYERTVLSPVVLHIFELDQPVWDRLEPVRFADRQRIRSDIALLNSLQMEKTQNFSYIAHLLNDIVYLYHRGRVGALIPDPTADSRIDRALEIMRSRFDGELTVAELARAVHLSYPQFCRLFVKQLRLTPTQYINQLRTDKAKGLLRTTDLPIKAVAAECGFKDIYYFSNFFKAATGISPTGYRSGKDDFT